jgi:hypothetical protein
MRFPIYPNTKQIDIDMTNYPSGVYPSQIILDESKYEYDKIILQK